MNHVIKLKGIKSDISIDLSSITCITLNDCLVEISRLKGDEYSMNFSESDTAKSIYDQLCTSLEKLREHTMEVQVRNSISDNCSDKIDKFLEQLGPRVDKIMSAMSDRISNDTKESVNSTVSEIQDNIDKSIKPTVDKLTTGMDTVGKKLFDLDKSFQSFKVFDTEDTK